MRFWVCGVSVMLEDDELLLVRVESAVAFVDMKTAMPTIKMK